MEDYNGTVYVHEYAQVETSPNGSCILPPAEFLLEPEFLAPLFALEKRIVLRVIVLVFAIFSGYISAMLWKDMRKREKREIFARNLIIGRLCAACLTTIILTYNSLSLLLEIDGNVNCNWFWKSENGLYWLNITVIYGVLWLRQRTIYNEPNLRQAVSKMTSFFSLVTVVLVIALPVTNSVLFSLSMTLCYAEYQRMCIFIAIEEKVMYYNFVNVTEFVVPLLLVLTLLWLFVWPIIQYRRAANEDNRATLRILRRIVVLTVVCLLTDMAAMTCNIVSDIIVGFTMHQLSAFSNLVCLVLSFADWRTVLLPRKCRARTNDSENSDAISLEEAVKFPLTNSQEGRC